MNLTNQQKNLLEDKTLAEFPTLYLRLSTHYTKTAQTASRFFPTGLHQPLDGVTNPKYKL